QVGPGWSSPGNVDNAKLDAFAVFSVSGGASLAIAAAAASKAEGNTGSTPFTFTVTRSGDTTGASSATYTVSGSAANPANAADPPRLRRLRQPSHRCRLPRPVAGDAQLPGVPVQPAHHHQRRRRHHGGGQR